MAKYRYVQSTFWTDVDIIDNFSVKDRYFYLYLLTNPHNTQCGVYQISINQIKLETGLPRDTVFLLIDRFQNKFKKIKYNKDTSEIAIINWLKYNNSTSRNTQICIQKEFDLVKDKGLIDVVKYKTSPYQAPTKGDTYNKKKNKNKNKNKKENEGELEINEELFDVIWSIYPRKDGRKMALKYFLSTVHNEEDLNNINKALTNYKKEIEKLKTEYKYVKMGSKWFNNWQDWTNRTTSDYKQLSFKKKDDKDHSFKHEKSTDREKIKALVDGVKDKVKK